MSDAENQLSKELQNYFRWRRRAFIGWLVGITGIVASFAGMQNPVQRDVLRVRGLIVVDAQGRDRIAIGAPIPDLRSGKRDSQANGLVIVGENGADHLVLGSPTPGPMIDGKRAKRIFPSTGLQLNDLDGNERGGFSYLHDGRVILGMDRKNGEGVALFVMNDGAAGIWLTGLDRRQRAVFAVKGTEGFPGWVNAPEGSPILVLNDSSRAKRVVLGLDASGEPIIQTTGPNGKRLVGQ
jgi:hypothetical protein